MVVKPTDLQNALAIVGNILRLAPAGSAAHSEATRLSRTLTTHPDRSGEVYARAARVLGQLTRSKTQGIRVPGQLRSVAAIAANVCYGVCLKPDADRGNDFNTISEQLEKLGVS